MTRYELKDEYFRWLCHYVCDDQYLEKTTYHKLMRQLDDTPFEYIIARDGNRAEDGMDLRYRFAYEEKYDHRLIASELDDRPCSVLEMMVALCLRCEDHIMYDPDLGDRTGQWFWNMIVSLGLGTMTDANYDSNYVDDILQRFMQRKYKRTGEGGLFTIPNARQDMRDIEIWSQLTAYLNYVNE